MPFCPNCGVQRLNDPGAFPCPRCGFGAPAAQGPGAPKRSGPGAFWHRLNRTQRWTVAFVVVIGVLAAIGAASGSNNGSAPTAPTTTTIAATFSGSVGTMQILDPAEVTVAITVTNTSQVTGKPSFCEVDLQSPDGAYNGHASDDRAPTLQPGQTWSDDVTMTISNQGATYITGGSVQCS